MAYKTLFLGFLSWLMIFVGAAFAVEVTGKVIWNGKPCSKCGPIKNSWSKDAIMTDGSGDFQFKLDSQKNKLLIFYYGDNTQSREVCRVTPGKTVSLVIHALFSNANDRKATGASFQKATCDGEAAFPLLPPVPAFPPMPGLPPAPPSK